MAKYDSLYSIQKLQNCQRNLPIWMCMPMVIKSMETMIIDHEYKFAAPNNVHLYKQICQKIVFYCFCELCIINLQGLQCAVIQFNHHTILN